MAVRQWWRGAEAAGTVAVLLVLLAPIDVSQSGRIGQAAGGTVHVVLFAGLAWLWRRNLTAGARGWALWGGLALFSAAVEWLQPHLGRSAEWSDWLYGMSAAVCICGNWEGVSRVRMRLGGVVALAVLPWAWEGGMVQMERQAFPVVADPGAVWARRGWALNGVRLSAIPGTTFAVESDASSAQVSVSYPGLFRTSACPDWNAALALRTKIFWPGSEGALFAIRVDDRSGNPPYADRFQREFSVTTGWNSVYIPIAELGQTPSGRPLDLTSIRQWGVFLVSAGPLDYFLLDVVRLESVWHEP